MIGREPEGKAGKDKNDSAMNCFAEVNGISGCRSGSSDVVGAV